MQATLGATPVIDELSSELFLVGAGAVQARRLLGAGDPDGCRRALVQLDPVLESSCARRFLLKLFAASRRDEVAQALEALSRSLDAVELELLAARRACAEDDLTAAFARIERAATAALEAATAVAQLAEGALGMQIRLLACEGFLD